MKIYELTAQNDARESFYGKTHVIDYENGTLELQSYSTIVSPLYQWQSKRVRKVETDNDTASERIQ